MRHTDLHSGSSRLKDALKSLQAAWIQVDAHWRDSVRDEFQQNYIEPIEQETQRMIDAISRLAEVLSRAEHECR